MFPVFSLFVLLACFAATAKPPSLGCDPFVLSHDLSVLRQSLWVGVVVWTILSSRLFICCFEEYLWFWLEMLWLYELVTEVACGGCIFFGHF